MNTNIRPADQRDDDNHTPTVGGAPSLDPDHEVHDTHAHHVGVDPLTVRPADQTSHDAHPDHVGGSAPFDPGQCPYDTQTRYAGVDPFAADHPIHGTQARRVGGEPSTPATAAAIPNPEPPGSSPPPPASQRSDDTHGATAGGWLELRIWSEQLDDAMAARIAASNRAERGGVDPVVYDHYITALSNAEHVCELAMKRCYRRVVPPEIIAWQKASKGLGEKLIARLLGHLGDPCIAIPHRWEGTGAKRRLMVGEPYLRTVAQLWQYCGVGDPTRRKAKGMTADELFGLGNPMLKMLLRLNAEACIKTTGHYRDVYDKARASYDPARLQNGNDTQQSDEAGWVKTHTVECVRCGPSGKPAQPGSPWSLGHQHAAALRKVSKEILRDLWRVRHEQISRPASTGSIPMGRTPGGTLDPPTKLATTPNRHTSAGEPEQTAGRPKIKATTS